MATSNTLVRGRPIEILDDGLPMADNLASLDLTGSRTVSAAGDAVEDNVGGDVSAAANLGDNLLVRGDGAGKGIQSSGISIDDLNKVSGIDTLTFDADTNTQIWEDASGNMTFKDEVTGTRTLKNIGCPVYLKIKATAQNEGDLHLTGFGVSKALIYTVRVKTSSTDWDLYILQNDNGYSTDDANIPKMLIVEQGSGDMNVLLNLPYEDEDASDEVHLYYLDNSGANTADIYLIGTELI